MSNDPLDIEQFRTLIAKLLAESGRLQAEQEKFNAEQAKLNRRSRHYPFLALCAFFGAAILSGKLLFGG